MQVNMATEEKMTPVGFENTPFRNGTLSDRLRPVGQMVFCMLQLASSVLAWLGVKRKPQLWKVKGKMGLAKGGADATPPCKATD